MIATRLYFLFALVLFTLCWKICQDTGQRLEQLQNAQAAQIDRLMGDN